MPPDAQAALREPTVVPVAMQERVVALDAERRDAFRTRAEPPTLSTLRTTMSPRAVRSSRSRPRRKPHHLLEQGVVDHDMGAHDVYVHG